MLSINLSTRVIKGYSYFLTMFKRNRKLRELTSSAYSAHHARKRQLHSSPTGGRRNVLFFRTGNSSVESLRSLYNEYNRSDAWKLKVLEQTRVIVTPGESARIIEDIINPHKPPPNGKVVVALDCEGINLGIKGQVTLIQVATMSGQVYVFDLFTCPSLVQAGGLQKLLEHKNVIKVIHDCSNDSICLYNQYKITLTNVFDTQAAHTVLQFQETGEPVYQIKHVKLNTLCDHYGATYNPLKGQVKNIYRKDQRYWSRRPMTRDMLIYASSDVLCLVPQVYNTMSRLIKPEMQGLLAELCEKQIQIHIRPEEIKARKRQRVLETKVANLTKNGKSDE